MIEMLACDPHLRTGGWWGGLCTRDLRSQGGLIALLARLCVCVCAAPRCCNGNQSCILAPYRLTLPQLR